MTLAEGDLLLTGTPSGVSRVVSGDTVQALLTDLSSQKRLVSWKGTVVDRQGGYHFSA